MSIENQFCRCKPGRMMKCQYANGAFTPVSIAHANTRMPVAPAGTTVVGIRYVTDPWLKGRLPRIAALFLFGSTETHGAMPATRRLWARRGDARRWLAATPAASP